MSEDAGSDEAPTVLALDDPAVVVDADLRVVAWNDPFERVGPDATRVESGARIETVLGDDSGQALRDIVPISDEAAPVTCTTVLGGDDEREYEIRVHRHGDGYTCILRDVTESRARRRELEERESVLEALPTPVYHLNTESRFEYVNEALAELLDIPRDRFIDEHTSVEMGMPPADIQEARRLTADLLSGDPHTGDSATFDMTAFTRNAGEVPCENNMALLLDGDEFVGTAGTLRDITDERRLEQRIEVMERVLRHNLRTEVMIIDGHAELVEGVANDPTLVDAIARIRTACDRLIDLGDRTQYVGEAIATDPEGLPVELHETVQKAVDTVNQEFPTVPIDVEVDESVEVAAGRSLFRALVELLRNAIVHNDAGEPRVEISSGTAVANTMLEFEGREEQVIVQIRDNGPGVPEHERTVVTGDGSESNLQHSDGLGLWMASWVIEAYGGQLSIRDAEPRGTVVELSLPKPAE